jgi:hypothetical protein
MARMEDLRIRGMSLVPAQPFPHAARKGPRNALPGALAVGEAGIRLAALVGDHPANGPSRLPLTTASRRSRPACLADLGLQGLGLGDAAAGFDPGAQSAVVPVESRSWTGAFSGGMS